MKKLQFKKLAFLLVVTSILFAACSKNSDTTANTNNYATLIIGRWLYVSDSISYTDFTGNAKTYVNTSNASAYSYDFTSSTNFLDSSQSVYANENYTISGSSISMQGQLWSTIVVLDNNTLQMSSNVFSGDTVYDATNTALGIEKNMIGSFKKD